MATIQSKTIVFLTGAYVGHNCWDNWKTFFENKGYTTHVPPWPHKDATPAVLRSRHPDRTLATLTLEELTAHYMQYISRLPEKPILIGHSFGGLLTQLLLNKGFAAAGIAIHSVPPQSVFPLEFTFYKSNAKSLGFFTSLNKTYLRSFKSWQYAFTNGMSLQEQQTSYEQLVIPESKRTLRGALGKAGHIDFKKAHAPLLMLSGSIDQCIPPTLNARNFNRYKNNTSVKELVHKQGRNHFILGQPTWKEDASFILNWINQH